MLLTTPEAQDENREFYIYVAAGAEQGTWRASSSTGIRGLNRNREFVLSDAKPNIFRVLKQFLHQEGVSINDTAQLQRYAVRLNLTTQQFNSDRIGDIVDITFPRV